MIFCRNRESATGSWSEEGRLLRLLADRFEQSEQRRQVRAQAESTAIESLDAAAFMHILEGLWQVRAL